MIAYASRTGNVRSIVKSLDLASFEISKDLIIDSPYLLFTYTDGLGDIPKRVEEFLSNYENKTNIKGVIVSGNINFGTAFCKAADTISKEYNVPIVRKIDLRGTKDDIKEIKHQYKILIEGEYTERVPKIKQ